MALQVGIFGMGIPIGLLERSLRKPDTKVFGYASRDKLKRSKCDVRVNDGAGMELL